MKSILPEEARGMIRFQCQCGRTLQAREQDVGKQAQCPACSKVQTVPAEGESFTAAPPPPPPPPRDDSYRDDDRRDRDRGDDRRARRRRDDYDDRDDDPGERRRRSRDDGGAEQVSGKATVAMILGITSFCLSLLTGLPAVVLAILALRDIDRSGGRLGGRGIAVAGLVCSAIGILFSALVGILLVPAYQKVNEARDRTMEMNNLKQVGIALHNHHDATGHLPQAAAYRSPDGKPLLSWRVAILPYVEQENLYRQFRLDEPWDSAHNKRLLPLMPKIYQQPGRETSDGTTYYQAFVGPGTAFEEIKGPGGRIGFPGQRRGWRMTDFTDGTSNTILVGVAESSVPWTAPQDMVYDPNGPLPTLSKRFSAGACVIMADGAARVIRHDISQPSLRNAITRNDGMPIGPDW